MQLTIDKKYATYYPPKTQLLKWVGNKQRFAGEIAKYFPVDINRFYEPFLGSGAITATVSPHRGFGSDVFAPLIEIWKTLVNNPDELIKWYNDRRKRIDKEDKNKVYEEIKTSYNSNPNGPDFLFLTRSCYGGIVRFRKADGHMSTPCGVHDPISIRSFSTRVNEWYWRMKNVEFASIDYQEAFTMTKYGDFIYCDPPYSHSQSILYGAQDFSLVRLLEKIDEAKAKGTKVALSIDGSKKSGNYICDLPIPRGLFEREININLGRSMLRRFQMGGQTLEQEIVSDRLLLTY
ncbi:Dam family site-specific DNA-(adenine-N6)-methyltransferase [bacterium]|nr:Dam family site-specific DNA-(adenine-N6)-methyltransferase [bacterium]MBU1065362.1 Dam family site-specific DNA-(adenine-N6)-methyltransferase [bacterium]MBU1634501.1 Dam family site-specific DNA-(adenine-N6)-methyltransferase [bacterium]MBU1872215.1 Dam family site-specific DNA-(adenine-N6)-methyltransferase [bacterium]